MIVALENKSTVISDLLVSEFSVALQLQITYDFAPVWNINAEVIYVPRGSVPPANAWSLVIFDNSDQAGALGYHDVTAAGLPLGKVFAKDDIQNGYSWSVTASHECMEMLVDPETNLSAMSGNRLFAYEVADACEDDQFGYRRRHFLLSDFVTPAWFTSFTGPYDFQNKISAPFQLLPGGYIGYMDVSSKRGWQQLTADKPKPSRRLELRKKRFPAQEND